jgi:hypothetical protein
MPGPSRSKDGVLSHTYVPGIHVLLTGKGVDGGHDGESSPILPLKAQ